MYKHNKNLIIQSPDFLVQSSIPKFSLKIYTDLLFELFHCGIKCRINRLSIKGTEKKNEQQIYCLKTIESENT